MLRGIIGPGGRGSARGEFVLGLPPSGVVRLAGMPRAQIVTSMQEFRTGQRPATVMDRLAKGFSEAEIASIAAWYAAQPQ